MTEEQQEQVRRLLAEARHDEPMPDDVVTRLDDVLAGLADEPARSATVVRLADRRRRATRMLLAAAAVVVVGIGGAQLVRGAGDSELAESSAGAGNDAPAAADSDGGGSAPEGLGAEAEPGPATRPFKLRSGQFSRDARALQRLDPVAQLQDGAARDDAGAGRGSTFSAVPRAAKQPVCEPGDWGSGGFFAVVYDGAPGWMVLRPPAGDTQVADLFLCGSDEATRSVTLPLP